MGSLRITALEERVVFDAALAGIIADVVSNHSTSDASLISATSGLNKIYVDTNINTSARGYVADGKSWSHAYTSVQDALNAAIKTRS